MCGVKMKTKSLIQFFIIFSLINTVYAHEGETIDPTTLVKHDIFDIRGTKGRVHVLVHKNGHTLGKPFVIEIRPDCEGNADWNKLPVMDVESACEVSVSSTKINKAGNEIIVRIKGPDQKAYNSGDLKILKSKASICSKEIKEQRFDISSFCKNN